MKFNKKWIIIAVLICFLFGVSLYVFTPSPTIDSMTANYPSYFSIPNNNTFEVQGHNQCSAFATAFVTLTEQYFSTLWENGLPLFNHVYIEVEK